MMDIIEEIYTMARFGELAHRVFENTAFRLHKENRKEMLMDIKEDLDEMLEIIDKVLKDTQEKG